MGANPVTIAAASLGAAGMNAFPTRVAASFIKAQRSLGKIVLGCDTQLASELASGPGQTMNVIRASAPNVAPADLVDGNNMVLNDGVEVASALTLNHYATTHIGWTDVAKTFANAAAFDALIAGRTASLLNSIEHTVAAYAATVFTTNRVGNFHTAFNYTLANTADRLLIDNRVPQDGNISGYITPAATEDALNDATIRAAFNQGLMASAAPSVTGMAVGATKERKRLDITGEPWYTCNEIDQGAAGTEDGALNLLFHKQALIFGSRPVAEAFPGLGGVLFSHQEVDGMQLNIIIGRDPQYLGVRVTLTVLYGVIVGREVWGCVVSTLR